MRNALYVGCTNQFWGYEFEYPAAWHVWEATTPALACSYLDSVPFTGTTDGEAFDQATLVVEMYEGEVLEQWLAFLDQQAPHVETVTVAGIESVLAHSAPGEFGVYSYTIPVWPDRDDSALVVSGWEVVNDALAARVDALANSLEFPPL